MNMDDLVRRMDVIDRLEINRPAVDKDSDRQRARFAQWQADREAVLSVARAEEVVCVAKIALTDEQVQEAFEKAKCEILAAMQSKEEIVYCGECIHMMANGKCRQFADSRIRPSASDFCSAGERRTNG